MSQELLIVVDNESDTVIYSGREWIGTILSRWYGGSSMWPTPATGFNGSSGILYGSLDFAFHGTAVALYGNTPRIGLRNATVSIDGGSSYNSSFPNPTSQTYLQWYQSPQLSEGNHTISLTNLADVSVDFIVVTAGPDTPLSGQTIIVDDDDPSIHYIGSWGYDKTLFNSDPSTINPEGFPFHNGTHRSLMEGNALAFEFSGTSIGVFGIFDFSVFGNLSIIFDLDSQSTPLTYAVGPDTLEFKAGVGRRPNFPYFSRASLAEGNHTLTINITQSNEIPFILDFLTYRSEANPPPSCSSSPPSTRISPLARPIIGSVIGVLAVFLIIILTCLYLRRRKKNGAAWVTSALPTCLCMRRRRRDDGARPASTRPSTNPDLDWRLFRSADTSQNFQAANATTSPGADQNIQHRFRSLRPPSVADTQPTPKRQQRIQDQIRNIEVVIAELKQMRAEGGDITQRNNRIAQLRARLGNLTSGRAHLDTVAPLPSY
ncbi:hypothetical protein BD779DRAFT_198630 [Infundibulicybe gibba]|nr:hypothetical protein BD779DRAFT_198630 [Infundibulicybe gibba]